MIDFVSGNLVEKKPMQVVIENNGIGYILHISLHTYSALPESGMPVQLKTYLHVRDDSMQFFGFATEEERQVFAALISVSGVGPKLAQTILCGIQAVDLVSAIQSGDTVTLTGIRGVGRKTAQRLVVELNEKLSQLGVLSDSASGAIPALKGDPMQEEALLALISLGYKKQEAEKALQRVKHSDKQVTVEDLIKIALQSI